ncbi:MAG: exonuclease domain-containing protein [Methanosphaera sp.]|nr:exonuclease domain-containing protein [Methanosphaera sp.]
MKDYVVFDLETPNKDNNTISSIALLVVRDNEIVKSISQLINPESRFDRFNINLTGITPEDVLDSPTFDEYWPQISDYLTSNIVVGHNVTFDLKVLSKVLDSYDLEVPEFDYCCTLRLSRKHFDLRSYRLSSVANHINYEYDSHIAIEDANASYEVLKYINDKKEISLDECGHYHYRLKFEKSYDEALATNLNFFYGMLYMMKHYKRLTSSQFDLLKKWHDENKDYGDTTTFNNLNIKLNELLSKEVITNLDINFLATRTPLVTTSNLYTTKTLILCVLKGIVKVIKSDNEMNLDELNVLYDWLIENNLLKGSYFYDNILDVVKNSLTNEAFGPDDESELSKLFDNLLIINSPVNEPLSFDGRTYCLTGDFEHGSREDIESILDDAGLVGKSYVTTDTDYIFVGNLGSSSWKYGYMGEKFSKAVELVEKNSTLKIIDEEKLFEELGSSYYF